MGGSSESWGKDEVLEAESESEEVSVLELCSLERFRESDDRSAEWLDRQKDGRFVCSVFWHGKANVKVESST